MNEGGYAVKTKDHLLLLNDLNIDTSLQAGLFNGRLNPGEPAGWNVGVLTPYPKMDHGIEPGVLRLAKLEWISENPKIE
jgi:hypothetical protein